MTLWGGRFSEASDADLRRLNDSLPFDRRLYAQDIDGSIAYARALTEAGVLNYDEMKAIINGLEQIRREFQAGEFVFAEGDEDIHTAVERRLTEIAGDAGGKIHTGRSRNDQVATDFRLWVLSALKEVRAALRDLQVALLKQAEQHINTLMPGYTHLQPAQPISAAHWFLSFFWMLDRDQTRLAHAETQTSVMPLGSGALSGTPYLIDRHKLAKDLGFAAISTNSLDAVSDRDFVAEWLFAAALLGTHLSRFGEDILLYSNPALNFVVLDERYSTGSSLMPQKRNADPMELARGKTGRLIGHLSGLLATLKGLPSGYNKDLQEDKEGAFDAYDTLIALLPVVTAIINTLQLNRKTMRAVLNDEMLSTDLADYLVGKGMPFRQAHHVVGEVVKLAIERELDISLVPLADLQAISPLFGDDVHSVFDVKNAIARRRAPGGTAPTAIREQIKAAKARLDAVPG